MTFKAILDAIVSLFLIRPAAAAPLSVPRVYGPTQPFGPAAPAVNANDLDTLARTLWGEARGEGSRGMQAVANVIMNRLALARSSSSYARQFGGTVAEICKKPYQFSAWLASDPNRPKMLAVNTGDKYFRDALELAQKALLGTLPDITAGADHYHTKSVEPAWARGVLPVRIIGVHKFYKLTTTAIA